MRVRAALIVEVKARVAMVFLEWVGGVCTLFGVVIVIGGFVLSGLLINVVVVAGGRLLASGRVGGGGRSTAVVFCFGAVLLGKRVVV